MMKITVAVIVSLMLIGLLEAAPQNGGAQSGGSGDAGGRAGGQVGGGMGAQAGFGFGVSGDMTGGAGTQAKAGLNSNHKGAKCNRNGQSTTAAPASTTAAA